jgi:hypothetical protein
MSAKGVPVKNRNWSEAYTGHLACTESVSAIRALANKAFDGWLQVQHQQIGALVFERKKSRDFEAFHCERAGLKARTGSSTPVC